VTINHPDRSIVEYQRSFSSWNLSTSAYFTLANKSVAVVETVGSGANRSFISDTLAQPNSLSYVLHSRSKKRKKPPISSRNTPEARSIFVDAILSIREATEMRLGCSVEIISISYPQYLANYQGIVFDAALEIEPGIVRRKEKPLFRGRRKAGVQFRFRGSAGAKNHGGVRRKRTVSVPFITLRPHYIIMVDYQDNFLQLSLLDV
jgi:hypothetical protein